MKVSTYYKNVEKILDECIEKNPSAILYENAPEGVYFCKNKDKSYYAYFLPHQQILSCNFNGVEHQSVTNKLLSSACNAVACLAKNITIGKNKSNGKRVVRIENDLGVVSFFNKTFINKFPSNADYYLKDRLSPAVVGLWDKHGIEKLAICGCICPINMTDDDFISD